MQTFVRKIGNSMGMILPANLIKKYHLSVGDQLSIQDDGEQIVVVPVPQKNKYTLAQLLAECDESAPMPQELIDWDKTPEVGHEKW